MAGQWASLVADDNSLNTACAWANHNSGESQSSTAAGWAGKQTEPKSTASGWASLVQEHSDDDDDMDVPPAPAAIPTDQVVTYKSCENAIACIDGHTTLAAIRHQIRALCQLGRQASTSSEIGSVIMLYDKVLQKIADNGKREHFLDDTFESNAMAKFVV